MKLLYHGGCEKILTIDLERCRPHRDFGRGFYLTEYKEHAEERARFKSEIFGAEPVLSSFMFDDSAAERDGISILIFNSETPEWAEFVFNNREVEGFQSSYDIIIGPIADDGLRDMLRRVRRGEIGFQELSKSIKYRKSNIQYCFCTEHALKYLKSHE